MITWKSSCFSHFSAWGGGFVLFVRCQCCAASLPSIFGTVLGFIYGTISVSIFVQFSVQLLVQLLVNFRSNFWSTFGPTFGHIRGKRISRKPSFFRSEFKILNKFHYKWGRCQIAQLELLPKVGPKLDQKLDRKLTKNWTRNSAKNEPQNGSTYRKVAIEP